MDKVDNDATPTTRRTLLPFAGVGPDEQPPGARAGAEFSDQEAITRKIPVSARGHSDARPSLPVPPVAFAARLSKWTSKRVVISAVAAAGLGGAAVTLGKLAARPAASLAPTTASSAVTPHEMPGQAIAPEPVPPQPTQEGASPETRHIQITVRQPEATLTLDEGVIEGGRLDADVARDQKLHVLWAAAPGFVPLKKIISFANDVHLEIDLKKAPPAPRGGLKRRPPQPLAKAKSEVPAKATGETNGEPPPKQTEEFGMTLERPMLRRPGKQIDERDPYAP